MNDLDRSCTLHGWLRLRGNSRNRFFDNHSLLDFIECIEGFFFI